MSKKLAVIGVGNMAKAIISGIKRSSLDFSTIYLYDINSAQYESLVDENTVACDSVAYAVDRSDCVLLSVKPQKFPELLKEISALPSSRDKLYISIAAGITTSYIGTALNTKNIVRVLPNLPMVISRGVSAVCYNDNVSSENFELVTEIFEASGSVLKINEDDMNKTIGVTSSSPAYVFKFIKAMYEGAVVQGLPDDNLVSTVCDMIIGSAELIKSGFGTPEKMVNAVASKGGTTERALAVLDENNFEQAIIDAMKACTARADELGKIK
ncbi:MAG: pyrroline-5-carboxylate reductase [Clostridia bacterium]|nr:pyrroline-5-carboxylate reductase [Clostridia bacterium]